jgi:hypothetical protein
VQRPRQRTAGRSALGLAVGLAVAGTAVTLTGCSAHEVMASIGLPTSSLTQDEEPATPPATAGQPGALKVTGRQRAYLDALSAAGVKASSDLIALSIGSSVCQAHAAKQTDQEVWDYVLPLVRNDIRSSELSVTPPTTADINSATADYIRIATDRLC